MKGLLVLHTRTQQEMLGHLEPTAVGIQNYARAKRTREGNGVIRAWEEQSWEEGIILGELELWKEATSVKTTLHQEVGNGGINTLFTISSTQLWQNPTRNQSISEPG